MDCFQGRAFDKLYNSNVFFCKQQLSHFQQGRHAAVCLEGAIIVLACIIFSLFAASPPAVDPNAAVESMVWSYIGELVFNMLVLVGAVKMSDCVVREMMGL